MRRHRLVAALDSHRLRFAQHGGMVDQSRGEITEHQPARRRNRLPPPAPDAETQPIIGGLRLRGPDRTLRALAGRPLI